MSLSVCFALFVVIGIRVHLIFSLVHDLVESLMITFLGKAHMGDYFGSDVVVDAGNTTNGTSDELLVLQHGLHIEHDGHHAYTGIVVSFDEPLNNGERAEGLSGDGIREFRNNTFPVVTNFLHS